KREREYENFRQGEVVKAMSEVRKRSGDYLLATVDFKADAGRRDADRFARERTLESAVLRRWADSVDSWKKQSDKIFAPWFAFAALPEKEFAEKAKALAADIAKNQSQAVNPLVA